MCCFMYVLTIYGTNGTNWHRCRYLQAIGKMFESLYITGNTVVMLIETIILKLRTILLQCKDTNRYLILMQLAYTSTLDRY